MERLRMRFPKRKSVTPSMLTILTFSEILKVRKDLPKKIGYGSKEYFSSVVNIAEYLIEKHSEKMDAETIYKLREEIKYSKGKIKILNGAARRVENRAVKREMACADHSKLRQAPKSVVVLFNGKNYRIPLVKDEITRLEKYIRCGFCVSSSKKVDYVENFEHVVSQQFIQQYQMKDYIAIFIYIAVKMAGIKIENVNDISVEDSPIDIMIVITQRVGGKLTMFLPKLKGGYSLDVRATYVGKMINFTIRKSGGNDGR